MAYKKVVKNTSGFVIPFKPREELPRLPPSKISFIEIGDKSPAQKCLLFVDNGNLVAVKTKGLLWRQPHPHPHPHPRPHPQPHPQLLLNQSCAA